MSCCWCRSTSNVGNRWTKKNKTSLFGLEVIDATVGPLCFENNRNNQAAIQSQIISDQFKISGNRGKVVSFLRAQALLKVRVALSPMDLKTKPRPTGSYLRQENYWKPKDRWLSWGAWVWMPLEQRKDIECKGNTWIMSQHIFISYPPMFTGWYA